MAQLFALVVLAVVLPGALVLEGLLSLKWVLLGAGAWAVAVVVTAGPGAGLWMLLEKARVSPRPKAALWGVWSAICELGAAAVVFTRVAEFPAFVDAIGFGVGAGAVEAAITMCAAAVARKAAEDPVTGFMAWSGVLERALASVGHIASRGLVWVGLQAWVLSPALVVAGATFAIVDGIASYGSEAEWDWTDPATLKWFYGVVAVVTAIEVVALAGGLVALGRLGAGSA